MPYTNDPSEEHQTLEALANKHAQIQTDVHRYRCPQCGRFGIISGAHDYYGIIYRCSCLPVFWVISPETGEKVEEVES